MPLYPNLYENGVLSSGDGNGKYSVVKPRGSFYLEMIHWLELYLNLYPDWDWLINFRTKETFKASDFKKCAKR